MKEIKKKDKIIEDELLEKALKYNYTKELDKVHDQIAQLRLVAISYQNIIKEKDKEIERLNNIRHHALGYLENCTEPDFHYVWFILEGKADDKNQE